MGKYTRIVALLFSVILVACLFAACGAEVATHLTVTKEFSGERKIEVKINQDDLDTYVTGGIQALKSVADSKLPAEMTCTQTADANGAALVFTITFKDIADYRQKVTALLEDGGVTDITPNIAYENADTVFKTGVRFEENFTSGDLLQWYFNALQEANIITHSTTSEWYELGGGTLIVDGQSFESGSRFSVDAQEQTCIDDMQVHTDVRMDGSFYREILFLADASTLEALNAKGCDFEVYLKDRVPEEAELTAEEGEDSSTYTVSFEAEDAEELIEKTDAVLQTENAFSVTMEVNTDVPGTAKVTLEERLDGSYYLDYGNSNPLQSTVTLFDNVAFSPEHADDTGARLEDGTLTYYPQSGSVYTFDFDWRISFKTVEILPRIQNEKNIEIAFVFTTEEALDNALKDAAVQALEDAADGFGTFSKNGDTCTLEFSGAIASVLDEINQFIGKADNGSTENEYFTLATNTMDTAPKYTTGVFGSISYDLSPVIGDTKVCFNDIRGLLTDYYFQGSFSTDAAGNRVCDASATVSFATVKVSAVVLVLLALSVVALLAGIVLGICFRKQIVALVKACKPKKVRPQATVAAVPGGLDAAAAANDEDLPAENQSAAAEAPAQPDTHTEAMDPSVSAQLEPLADVAQTPASAQPRQDDEEELL